MPGGARERGNALQGSLASLGCRAIRSRDNRLSRRENRRKAHRALVVSHKTAKNALSGVNSINPQVSPPTSKCFTSPVPRSQIVGRQLLKPKQIARFAAILDPKSAEFPLASNRIDDHPWGANRRVLPAEGERTIAWVGWGGIACLSMRFGQLQAHGAVVTSGCPEQFCRQECQPDGYEGEAYGKCHSECARHRRSSGCAARLRQ